MNIEQLEDQSQGPSPDCKGTLNRDCSTGNIHTLRRGMQRIMS
ncbi:hypothetical protein COOONC_05918 [Cooperia oncophora]